MPQNFPIPLKQNQLIQRQICHATPMYETHNSQDNQQQLLIAQSTTSNSTVIRFQQTKRSALRNIKEFKKSAKYCISKHWYHWSIHTTIPEHCERKRKLKHQQQPLQFQSCKISQLHFH